MNTMMEERAEVGTGLIIRLPLDVHTMHWTQ